MKATDPDDPEQAEAMRRAFKRLLLEQAVEESRKGNGNMKTETKHTETPWTCTKLGNNADQWGVYADADTRGGYVVLAVEGEANAAFIVEACNSHDKLKRDRDALLEALKALNHMGGDERGGYCICPLDDGSAPDFRHSTSCFYARTAIAQAESDSIVEEENPGRVCAGCGKELAEYEVKCRNCAR